MQPLSNKKRNKIFAAFGLVFLLTLPFLILYSTGFRFSEKSLIKTGGLYVHKPLVTEITITLNEKPLNEKFTSFLQRYYFVQSLREDDYKVRVTKGGYYSWEKTVPVTTQRITEVAPFLIPTESLFEEIPKNLETTKTEESTTIVNPLYSSTVKLFNEKAIAWRNETREYELAKKTYDTLVTDLEETYEEKEEEVTVEDLITIEAPRLHLRSQQKFELWQDEATYEIFGGLEKGTSSLPYFCDNAELCSTPKLITTLEKGSTFEFFPGRTDVILYNTNKGLFAAEIDTRSMQHVFPVYQGQGIEFVTANDDTIYIKDGDTYLAWEIY